MTQNGKVVRETIGSGSTATVLDFIYDASGRPFALIYDANSTDPGIYYYILNLQGDVVGLIDDTGSFVAEYTYDAWGKVLTATGEKAEINPLRYRGYYYDTETGFYYLQSRYYDPELRRFINADTYASTDSGDAISCNMFAYCCNNPISRSDESGEFWNIVIGAVVGAVVSAVVTAVDSYVTTGSVDWADVAVSAAVGAASGAIAATGIGAIAPAGVSAAGNAIQQGVDIAQGQRESFEILQVAGAGAMGFATSIAGTAAGKLASGKMLSAGEEMVSLGRDKALTGFVRRCFGQSGSSYIRAGSKLVTAGTKVINTARGISSVVGTVATIRLTMLQAALT